MQEVGKIVEVIMYKSEVVVVYNIFFGIFILVKIIQMCGVIQLVQNFFGMFFVVESGIYINIFGLDVYFVYVFV